MLARLELDTLQKLMVRELWRNGPLSRIEVAARLNVSPAAMTKTTRSLLALGFVEEAGPQAATARGRPSIPVRIAAAGGYAVGATLHRRMLDVALVNFAGGIIATTQERFDSPDPRVFARVLSHRIHDLAEQHQLLGSRMLGVGLGVPGPTYSPEGEHWYTVEDLAAWREVPLRRTMSEALALPVWIENDANAAAIAEYYLGGLAQHCSTAVVILLGHGIGAGVIDNAGLLRGEIGNTGEIGCLYPIDEPRPSTIDLMQTLQAAGCEISSVADLEARAHNYTDVIDLWCARAARQLELVINGANAWLDPGEIVLSGPLPRPLLEKLAGHLLRADLIRPAHRKERPMRISASSLGRNATALGAALLPIDALASIFG